MPNNKPTIDEQISKLMERFDEVNDFYIEKIAKQILTIGEMNQSSINRVVIMAEMNANMAEISARLAKALKQSVQDLYKIYQQAMQEAYTDPRFARALTETPLSDAAKGRLRQYTRAVSLQTAGTMQNLSNTTASSAQYRQIVDKAVLAVSSGLDSYQTATRESIRQLGYNGMQVVYESLIPRSGRILSMERIRLHSTDPISWARSWALMLMRYPPMREVHRIMNRSRGACSSKKSSRRCRAVNRSRT